MDEMNDTLYVIELWCRRVFGVASSMTLLTALVQLIRFRGPSTGRSSGASSRILRPSVLIIPTVAFLLVGTLLWRPLPISLCATLRIVFLGLGSAILLAGLLLYLWGLATLGTMFDASSGFAARLRSNHRLVTSGPYAIVRNPMYVGVMMDFLGGLLLYRTWTTLIYAAMMFFLPIRAHREEKLLAQEFGERWGEYVSRVPGWMPRIARFRK